MYYLVTKFIIYFNAKLFRQFVEAWKANTAKYFVLMIHCIMDIMDIHDMIWYEHIPTCKSFFISKLFEWVTIQFNSIFDHPLSPRQKLNIKQRNPLRSYFKNLLFSTKCWSDGLVGVGFCGWWISRWWMARW